MEIIEKHSPVPPTEDKITITIYTYMHTYTVIRLRGRQIPFQDIYAHLMAREFLIYCMYAYNAVNNLLLTYLR